jgi:hypothetical protein
MDINSRLVQAADDGNFDEVKDLVKDGADVNFLDDTGWTALLYASFKGHTEIARFLVKAGANLTAKAAKDGWTPLCCACKRGNMELIRFFLENGADIESADNAGFTPLLKASQQGHTEVVRFLSVEKGANIHVKDFRGFNAIHRAIKKNHLETALFLIDNGVDPFAKTTQGKTALDMASSPEIALALSERAAQHGNFGAVQKDEGVAEASEASITASEDDKTAQIDTNQKHQDMDSLKADIPVSSLVGDGAGQMDQMMKVGGICVYLALLCLVFFAFRRTKVKKVKSG